MQFQRSCKFRVGVHLADCHAEALSTEAWVDNFNVPLELDYSRNTSFIGRQGDLEHIHNFICDINSKKKVATPLVIHGTGGVGKTQLVREYVYVHAADFTSIIWIDAQSLQATQTSFLGFMQKLIYLHARRSMVTPPPYAKIARHLSMTGFIDETGRIILNEIVSNQVVSAG